MINLNAYDDAINKIDKSKTWIDINSHKLFSREIKFRKYYSICKRFNIKTKCYEYFIILMNEKPIDKISFNTSIDNYGRIKIKLNAIYNELNLCDVKENINISINKVECDDDSDVYEIDI